MTDFSSDLTADTTEPTEWWRTAVIYQIYPRSFADANGDGTGDLRGVTSRLDHLRDLGVDAIWLSPFYVSPMADAGYDVADYRDVDPQFGTLDDADALIAEAHRHDIRVIVDLVPNHTSDEHAWFRAAVVSPPGSPERGRYLFRDGRGESGELPPNSWRSVFGGSAWTRIEEADGSPGQWYLHLFDSRQPDLDWTNPEVREEFHDILRFWLDRGVDGFRVDVAHGLVKAVGLPEWDHGQELLEGATAGGERPPMWDQDGVHEIYRGWRKVLDTYEDRMLVAEAWVEPAERLARYVRDDEMHQAFNFAFLTSGWRAGALREAIAGSIEANDSVGAPSTWVLSNHDVVRHPSRLSVAPDGGLVNGIGSDDPQPDEEIGLRRARAATMLMLALPGSTYLYQGEELGLPEHTTLPDEVRQDPAWFRHHGEVAGRDGCRVPLPWQAGAPANGFSTTGRSWLPQPDSYTRYAADAQAGIEGSTLELYRAALRIRRERRTAACTLAWAEGYDDSVVAFNLPEARVLVVTNLGSEPVRLPEHAAPLLSSEPLDEHGNVPADVTVWCSVPGAS
ncbi:alpha-amylase family glycosyl hydrolase [Nocardioides sp.]|uniref:glycoside hydrolase family 13 protein n=1 Tax=Nocardioides sp. TaxID=35761 RepID=UPI002735096E|nr:alpha-amylase family glycosyl hydrolase [Nocardioides sp.]MDP3891228.1 alpha-amylase family glycosyl hydrolase [Nocardioides sp.]